MYIFVQTAFLSNSSYKSSISNIIFATLGFLPVLVIDDIKWNLALKTILNVILVFSISYIISYTISLITLFSVDITYYEFIIPEIDPYLKFSIDYPFSIFYRAGTSILELIVPRAIGMYREPGLFQIVVILAYFSVDFVDAKRKVLKKVVLVITLLFTTSTAGFASFLACLLYYYVFAQKYNLKNIIVGAGILTFISIVFIIYLSLDVKFGLGSKLSSNSGQVRLEATTTSLKLLSENLLFGIGAYSKVYDAESIGINFLGAIARLGIVGTLIVLIPHLYVMTALTINKSKYLVITLGLFLTLLLSQPLYDKALTFFLLVMANYTLTFKKSD